MTDKQREEWIEEKAELLLDLIVDNPNPTKTDMENAKDFIRTILNEASMPKVDYDFIKKEAGLLVSRFDCECGLTHLQKIGIRTVLTEKGDLWDILQRAGVEVEE